jgi:hypothetical protein
MMKVQLQAPFVPVQVCPVPLVQLSPEQQPSVGEQVCPAPEQVAPALQVPVVEPEGMLQLRPVQQSPEVLQAVSWGWHAAGAAQLPLVHTLEQHSELFVQALVLGLQVPASGVPASAPPLVPGTWHAEVSSEVGRHAVPAQQVDAFGSQLVPSAAQVAAAAQRRTPSAPGTQAVPLQHWSAKSQTLPAGRQQPAVPSRPLGHEPEGGLQLPCASRYSGGQPKQRGTPTWSRRQVRS